MLRVCCLMMLVAATAFGEQNVVVVLDDSGSMYDAMRSNRSLRKIDAAKSALRRVLSNVPDDAKIGVLALNSQGPNGSWVIPLAKVDRALVEHNVSLIQARGGTPLGSFLKIGVDELLKLRDQQIYGDYRLLIVTDGEASDKQLVADFLPDILSRGITVDVIGVDMSANHSLATQVHSYRRADDPEALAQAISEVLAESTTSSSDSDESDYDLLNGIPDEIAIAIIETLSNVQNQPIGTRNIDVAKAVNDGIALHETHRPNYQQARQNPSDAGSNPHESDQKPLISVMFIALIIFVVLFSALFSNSRRSAKHR